METLVCQVLLLYFQTASDDDSSCHLHVPHRYSAEMRKKSRLVNMGVIPEHPSTTAGVIRITDVLQKYVPQMENGQLYTVPCHRDALTMERIIDAKRARAAGHTKLERLEGVEPVPQEFHKRGIMLQDTLNSLFDARSAVERGTLFNMKNVFNHRNLKKHVMGNFNHVDDFMHFVTDAMICYLALQLCSLNSLDEPLTMHVTQLAKAIVAQVWLQLPMTDIADVLDAEVGSPQPSPFDDDDDSFMYPFCICQEDKGTEMIECDNLQCAGSWFHLECMNVSESGIPEGAWFCSEDCKSSNISWSLCNGCGNDDAKDHIFDYSKTVLW
ncbi:PREDICTED: uncharacterized protein LOC106811048 [Priapulus caudatus]|uniref:Uncharacterized protein LOC106811048 n=1 Tax=Priapulus caudatus TaxID=37621 RepID=A0ABM1ECY4_PRICU|nr:PREDICTED: uncharacterized protein LOC106811048 [Priapulus caudatus]XP_014670055.1 PREDICTED: uncharacterized protein LOC106811048 [Priapulus caudatus]